MLNRVLAIAAFMTVLWGGAAAALDKPKGDPILVVTGEITHRNVPSGAAFDMQMLSSLPQTKFETKTRWTDKATFEGVLLKDLLAAVGARGTEVNAKALNDFSQAIPIQDTTEVPVLVATKMNGEPMRIRDRGPLWIVYDVDDRPDLQNAQTEAKMVWQLKELTVR
jgi:hypothetical protein